MVVTVIWNWVLRHITGSLPSRRTVFFWGVIRKQENPRHIYYTLFDPHVLPVLELSNYLLSNLEFLYNGTKMLPYGSKYNRFMTFKIQ